MAGQSVIFTDAPGFDSRYRCCDFAKGKYEKHKFKYATMLTDAEEKIVSISQELLCSAEEFFKNFCKIK